MKGKQNQFLSLLAAFMLAAGIFAGLPLTARAADSALGSTGGLAYPQSSSGSVIDVGDSTTASGTGWTYSSGLFTVTGDVTVTGTTGTNRLAVEPGANVTITLDHAALPAINVTGATLDLILSGANTLNAGNDETGLNVPDGAAVTIDAAGGADDSLTVSGGSYGAGIGGAVYDIGIGGKITINGGTVNAYGNWGGAGIGGNSASGGTIIINGGVVNAYGGAYAAGIGGGIHSDGGTIRITGGIVNATGGQYSAGIGGGYYGSGGTITITGGIVNATGTQGGAGIGSGNGGDGGTTTISGGNIVAIGGTDIFFGGGAGIGSGGGMEASGSSGNITITGNANVTATGGEGQEYITPEGSDMPAVIKEGGGAGIGSGGVSDRYGSMGDVGGIDSIIIHTTGTVTVTGGSGAAGNGATIGTGGSSTNGVLFPGIPVKSITISGAPVQYAWKAAGGNKPVQLTAAVMPTDATIKDITWSVSNTKIAAVKAGGLLTFTGTEGTVRVTAVSRSAPDVKAYKDIKVVKNVTKIDTPMKTVYIQKGKSLTIPKVTYDGNNRITAGLTWKSSNAKIAKAAQTGKITGVKKGKAIITATAKNGKKLAMTISVSGKPVKLTRVTVSIPASMKAGQMKKLAIKLSPAKATGVKITFKSSNAGGLYVDKAGKLTAVKKGKYTVTIKIGSKIVKKKITVK